MHVDEDRRRVAEALTTWWAEAGVDVAPPGPSGGAPKRATPSPPAPPRADATPVQRPAERRQTRQPKTRAPAPERTTPSLEAARAAAAGAGTLNALAAALSAFDAHPLHAGAMNTVFARGDRDADVMVIGEAPGRDEDRQGAPFVGRSGGLLDAMFAAVGRSGERGLYITNVVNWRPPDNRSPSTEEIALCLPFLDRHIALMQPKALVLVGGVAAQAVLRVSEGVTRLRGAWRDYTPPDGGAPIPARVMFHPAFVLRRPITKRDAWNDLLEISDRFPASDAEA